MDESSLVLNPFLYRRLLRNFGSVVVSSVGEAMLSQTVTGIDEGDKRLIISHAGEYYHVNCLYCNDTGHRLYVNHMSGKVDGHGRKMNYLAICYNEDCLSVPENRQDFYDKIVDLNMTEARIKPGKVVSEEAREVMLPGPCTPLTELAATHKCRGYLESRGFCPDTLTKKFGLSFCRESKYSYVGGRLIIPVYDRGKLKGWQARYVGELDWKGSKRKSLPPKYFSCPNSDFRSKCIYNFDEMCKWQTGVIVEGPTDTWRFGSMSGCIFGNTMTTIQKRRFLTVFRTRSAVLLLDPEEFNSKATVKLIGELTQKMPGRFCAVKLPEGTDPGSLGRPFLRAYVKEQAAKQGVKVIYKRVGCKP